MSMACSGSRACGGQQCVRHLHRVGGAHHHQVDLWSRGSRRAGGGLQPDQRAHAVADDAAVHDAGGIQQRQQPVGQASTLGQRRPRAAAVAGRSTASTFAAVVREPARQQVQTLWSLSAPCTNTSQGRPGEGLAAGVGVGLAAVDVEFIAPACDQPSRRLQRALQVVDQVVGSSRPIDRRIVPGRCRPAPARRRPCGSGWSTPGGSPASGVADVGQVGEQLQRLDEGAALLARALQVEAEHRAAAARQQALCQRVARDGFELRVADAPTIGCAAGTRPPCACSRRAAPCAAAASRCPAGSARRCAGSCRRRSRAGPRGARAAGRRPTVFSSANTMLWKPA
jgi:hypothetical protein